MLDVQEHPDGLLHLLAHRLSLSPGQLVEVRLDLNRRSRLARAHTACILVRSRLAQRSQRVTYVEITGGLVWIELDGPPCAGTPTGRPRSPSR